MYGQIKENCVAKWRKTIIIAIQKENQTKNIYYLTLLDNLLLILFKFHFILNKISMKYNENVIKKRNISNHHY